MPVLIFDNCDSLAKKDQKMLEILQDTAKTAIDDSTWVTIFVGSVGETPEQMEGMPQNCFLITRSFSFLFQVEAASLVLRRLSKSEI